LNDDQPRLNRVLGPLDLAFFLIAALVNLNSIPVIAGIGPAALMFWVVAFILFFIPQALTVLELTARYPQEGGIYRWTKTAFGDMHGFVSGWCYWTNNIFYVPTLLFYIVGFATFVGGRATAGFADQPLFMATVSLVLLWVITLMNIRGFNVGKWVQSIGVTGTVLTTLIFLGIGIVTMATRGPANAITASTLLPNVHDWRMLALISVVCLNYTGLELGSVIGDEIMDPRRNMPRAILIAGGATVVLYLLSTFALQATVPAHEIGIIDGILQGVERAAANIQLSWIVVPIAVLMSLNAAGNTSAWLAGSSRIPFVIGIDRYLPAALGKTHPRYHTPHVALTVQAFASSLFIVINAVGTSVNDMYMILLQTTVILQLIPYLYMFLAVIRFRAQSARRGGPEGYFRKSWIPYLAGVLGFIMTAGGVVLAYIPSSSVVDVWNFEFKTILGSMSFIIPALLIFWIRTRRTKLGAPVPQTVEVAPD
jgi:glutamate:GABA antiporter